MKFGLGLLAFLLSLMSFGQTERQITYELINDKIISDSLSVYGFKMFWKNISASEEDVLSLEDSSHYMKTIILDSNKNRIDEYRSWYGDNSRNHPIYLSDQILLGINMKNSKKKWNPNRISSDVAISRSMKKGSGKRFFAFSNPLFFDDQKGAILTFYIVNEYAERYFIQVYMKNKKGKWIKYYDRLLWL
jgi:hypothetical protein